MNTKRCSLKLIKYEVLNIVGNPFADFFGVVFPILMLFVIAKAMKADVPAVGYAEACTTVFISLSMIIPMALFMLGYGATFSQELEKEIPLRMMLFGYSERVTMLAKAIAQMIVLTVALLIYTVVGVMGLELTTPSAGAVAGLILCHYVLAIIFFGIAHGVSNLFRKFGPTYAVLMSAYFGIMILCGMMGIQTDGLPKFLQVIARLLPMSHIGNDYIDVWMGRTYNFVPMVQAFLFFGAVSGIILMISTYRHRRNNK
jgi:ABC-2 type transport system permease protein